MPKYLRLSFQLAVIALFVFYLIIYGVFFERYVVVLESFFSGSIVGQPLFDFFNIAYIWIVRIFASLYQIFPGFCWFDASTILISILAFGLYMNTLISLCLKMKMARGLTFIFSLSAGGLLYFNLLSCNNSREVFILIILSLFHFYTWTKKDGWKDVAFLLINGCFFWFVVLMRFEFAALATVTFGGYMLFHIQSSKQQWKFLLLPGLIMIFMSGYLYYDRNYTNNYAKETDFSQYLVSDAQYFQSFEHFNTSQDSMRYIAAKEHWFSDTANLRIDFFRNLQQYKVGVSAKYFKLYFPFYLKSAYQMFLYFVQEDWIFVLFVLITLLYVLFEAIFVTKDLRNRWLKIFGPVATSFSIIFLLCYLVKMESTVFQPMCMVTILFLLNSRPEAFPDSSTDRSFLNSIFIIIYVLLFFYINTSLYQYHKERKNIQHTNIAICNEADSLAKGKFLFLDQVSNLILDHRPGHNFVFKQVKNILLYDNGQLILGEPFLSYHEKICRCNALNNADFYEFVYFNRKNTIFLSTPERMSFVFNYLHLMHGLPYGYREIKGNFSAHKAISFGMDLRYYEMIDLQ